MRRFPATPTEMIACLWRNRALIRASASRDVLGRYRGSLMGILWAFVNPLFMLTVYTFVFSVIFKARWNGASESRGEFALILFAGLIVFNLLSECVIRAPGLIVSNVNYVKKVVYPLEILPVVALSSALFHGMISLSVWLVAYSVLIGPPHWTIIYLPLILPPFMFFILGVSWVLASLGVYLRDISQVVGIMTTVLMYLSPIFYPATALPEAYRHLLYINPLTPAIEFMRGVLFWGTGPDPVLLMAYWLGALVFAWLGFAWFQKTRKGFADVL